MSIPEYVAQLDRDQLANLIEKAGERLSSLNTVKKQQYLVVGDDWCNDGWFEQKDWEAAIRCFVKEATKRGVNGTLDNLSIRTVKDYPDEVQDVLYKGSK